MYEAEHTNTYIRRVLCVSSVEHNVEHIILFKEKKKQDENNRSVGTYRPSQAVERKQTFFKRWPHR